MDLTIGRHASHVFGSGLALAALLALGGCASAAHGAPDARVAVAERAPELELPTTAGTRFVLSELRGTDVLLVFWSPSRPGADAELRRIAALERRLDPAVKVVPVAVLAGTDVSQPDIARMREGTGRDIPVVVMGHAYDAPAWAGIVGRPTSFTYVGADGLVRATGDAFGGDPGGARAAADAAQRSRRLEGPAIGRRADRISTLEPRSPFSR